MRLVYDVGGGVEKWDGVRVINILFPWKSNDESAISLLYISCNICILIL